MITEIKLAPEICNGKLYLLNLNVHKKTKISRFTCCKKKKKKLEVLYSDSHGKYPLLRACALLEDVPLVLRLYHTMKHRWICRIYYGVLQLCGDEGGICVQRQSGIRRLAFVRQRIMEPPPYDT